MCITLINEIVFIAKKSEKAILPSGKLSVFVCFPPIDVFKEWFVDTVFCKQKTDAGPLPEIQKAYSRQTWILTTGMLDLHNKQHIYRHHGIHWNKWLPA